MVAKNEVAPIVSVIIPVYNTEPYLHECLNSVINQTLKEIEIVCVNDGSTDRSLTILEEYSNKDSRIKILCQKNKGGGAARNSGLEIAKGEYMAFLDSDDYYDIQALEKAYRKALEDDADIVVFNGKVYFNESKKIDDAKNVFRKQYFPKNIPFSYHDVSDYVFNMFTSVAWNKLYKKNMIEQHGIRYQEIKRANDLYFAYLALIKAKSITILDESLIFYRTELTNNTQSTHHETPLDFFHAMNAVKDELKKLGIFEKVERSYHNKLLQGSVYTLLSIKKGDVFEFLYNKLKVMFLSEVDLNKYPEKFFHSIYKSQYKEAKKIITLSAAEYLFEQRNAARKECDALQRECEQLGRKWDALLASRSYRLGRMITWIPRKTRGFFRCLKENGIIYTIKLFVKKCMRKISMHN